MVILIRYYYYYCYYVLVFLYLYYNYYEQLLYYYQQLSLHYMSYYYTLLCYYYTLLSQLITLLLGIIITLILGVPLLHVSIITCLGIIDYNYIIHYCTIMYLYKLLFDYCSYGTDYVTDISHRTITVGIINIIAIMVISIRHCSIIPY